MARYLSIVENAYRATVEEQDDTAVWFTHTMKNAGADVGLLLRGDAVNYVLLGQDATGLRFGSKEVRVAPEIDKDILAIVQKKVPVYVVSEDLSDRGIPEGDVMAGIERVSRTRLANLVSDYDRVFHW
jgi:sulfur relay (sulfurtransferase) DsrF/TusC family protein